MTPTKRLTAITAGVSLLLIITWYFALFSPQSHSLKAAHKARAAAEQQITALDAQVASLNALKKQIPQDTQRLATYTAAVPDNPQLPTALQQIQKAASDTGVDLTTIDPATPAGSAGAAAAPAGAPAIAVSLNVTGSYQQLTAFIAALNSMSRTLVIRNINVSASGPAGAPGTTLQASLSTDIFYAGHTTP